MDDADVQFAKQTKHQADNDDCADDVLRQELRTKAAPGVVVV